MHGKWSVDHHTTYILLLLTSANSTVWGRVMENCMFFTCCFEADGEVEQSKPAFSSCPWLWQVARIWVLFCFVFLVCRLMGQKVGVILSSDEYFSSVTEYLSFVFMVLQRYRLVYWRLPYPHVSCFPGTHMWARITCCLKLWVTTRELRGACA